MKPARTGAWDTGSGVGHLETEARVGRVTQLRGSVARTLIGEEVRVVEVMSDGGHYILDAHGLREGKDSIVEQLGDGELVGGFLVVLSLVSSCLSVR